MSRVEETKKTIDYMTNLAQTGIDTGMFPILADIAVSLAVIADKLTEDDNKEEKE